MRRPSSAAGAALLAAVACWVAARAQTPGVTPPPDPALPGLQREQVALIDQAEAQLERLREAGVIDRLDPRWERWAWRRVEATRSSGAPAADRIKALERYVETLKRIEAGAESAFTKQTVDRLDVQEARYRRVEAEVWLAQEKAGRPVTSVPRG